MTPIEIRYEYTRDLARRAAIRFLLRGGRNAFIVVALLVGVAVARIALGAFDAFTWFLLATPLIVFLFSVAYLRRAASVAADLADPAMTVTADDSGITFRGSGLTSTLAWKRVKEVWMFADVWLFFPFGTAGGSFTALPTQALAPDAAAFISARLAEHGAKLRR